MREIHIELLAAAMEDTLDTEVTVADVDGMPHIMTEAWSLEVLFGDNILVISNLVVVEEWRRSKHRFGTNVVQAILSFAREYGLAVVAQQVLSEAVDFWERMDFVPSLAVPDNYIKDGHQALLYGEEHYLEEA